MKKLFILCVALIGILSNARSQKIYSTDADYKADIKVYVVDADYKADLLVYKVDADYQANGNEGKWYFTDADYNADKKIYFVDADYKADSRHPKKHLTNIEHSQKDDRKPKTTHHPKKYLRKT